MKIRTSIRLKVMISILVLITIIVAAIGTNIMIFQAQSLKTSIIDSAKRDAMKFGFLAARAILDNDDLSLSDNLQILQKAPGFVYGQVINNANNRPYVELYKPEYNDYKNKLLDVVSKANVELFNNIENLSKNEPTEQEITVPDVNNSFFNIYFPVYHPFIFKNPPLMGVVEIVFSDEVVRETIKKSAQRLIMVGIVFWIVGGFGSFFLSRFIVQPVNKLLVGAKEVSSGNLDYQVEVLTEDELGQLAVQFNAMTQGLKSAQKAKEEQLVLDEQIKQATEIQEGMNPMEFLDSENVMIKGYTRAAKGVGGDYFDFIILPDNRVAMLISDVSGKSISASLVMVLIKTVVSTYLKLFDYIRSDIILTTINKIMAAQAHMDKFATMIFLIYNPVTGELEFSNGGQGPLFIYRSNKKVCTATSLPGLPLGIDEDNDYSLARVKVAKGDMIVLYTDGVTEAYNPLKEEYTLKNLKDNIIKFSELNCNEIVTNIIEDIDKFADGAEQHDDMTLVVMKIK